MEATYVNTQQAMKDEEEHTLLTEWNKECR